MCRFVAFVFDDSYDLDQDLKLAQETTVLVESYTVSNSFILLFILSGDSSYFSSVQQDWCLILLIRPY